MAKRIVRLTESDMNRLVKRVIKEQFHSEIASKVEKIIEKPKVEMMIDNIVSSHDESVFSELMDELGIDENTSLEEIHSKITNYFSSDTDGEMTEEELEPSDAKHKVREILHSIGAGNIAAWGGVPAAIAIGSMTGMPLGFAISWGVTGLLMGIAKAMGKKD